MHKAKTVTVHKYLRSRTAEFLILLGLLLVLASKMQLRYLVACADSLEELTTRTESAFPKKVIKMLHGRFVQVGRTLIHCVSKKPDP